MPHGAPPRKCENAAWKPTVIRNATAVLVLIAVPKAPCWLDFEQGDPSQGSPHCPPINDHFARLCAPRGTTGESMRPKHAWPQGVHETSTYRAAR